MVGGGGVGTSVPQACSDETDFASLAIPEVGLFSSSPEAAGGPGGGGSIPVKV